MKSKVFYTVAGLILTIAVGHGIWRLIQSAQEDPNPVHYIYMSPTARMSELKSLSEEANNIRSIVSPYKYFEIIGRFDRLRDAMKRARLEEKRVDWQTNYKGVEINPASSDEVGLGSIENMYTFSAQQLLDRSSSPADFLDAQKKAGLLEINNHRLPADPLLATAWVLVYFSGLLLAFGHYHIRNKDLGGNFLLASDLRFWIWLFVWIPGLFRYPTAIDIKYQLRRAQRFVAFVISTCLPLTAACAGKRVKTEPDGKKSTEIAWVLRVNISTTTWPKYVGGDGAVFHPAPVQQTTVNTPLPKGFYLGLWNSLPLSGRELVPDYGYEIDLSSGWNGRVHGLNLNTDLTYVDVTPLAKYQGDVLQLSATASRDASVGSGQTLTPYFTLNYALPTTGKTPKQGIFLREGARWNWNHGPWSVGANAELFHDSGAFGFDSGFLVRGGVNVGHAVGQHLRVEVPFQWNTPLSRLNDSRRRETQVGLTLSIH